MAGGVASGTVGGPAGGPAGACAIAAAGLLAAVPLVAAAAGNTLSPLFNAEGIVAPWHVVGVPKQSSPLTRFAVERIDERLALRIEADKSYGNLVHELAGAAPAQQLRFSWRLQQGNPGADLRQRKGDDTPAKVCVGFDLPLDAVPFTERQLLRLARRVSGENLPAATLCYVWGGPEARESRLPNVYSARVRYVVLRNASDANGVWFDESRDLAADFRLSFGEEAAQAPPLVAVMVGGDSDNTGARTVAHLAALRLEP